MRVLLSNDDGIGADGITILEDALTQKGHEIWVCAPDGERSSCSHSLTCGVPLRIIKNSDRHFSFSGYPADCVYYAFGAELDIPRPDVLIAGINKGLNMGNDLLCSGTVGVASEGALHGIPSIAVSVDNGNYTTYKKAADFVTSHLEDFVAVIDKGSFLNINVPECANSWTVSTAQPIEYHHHYAQNIGDNMFYIKLNDDYGLVNYNCKGSDFDTVAHGCKISVSCVKAVFEENIVMKEKLRQLI